MIVKNSSIGNYIDNASKYFTSEYCHFNESKNGWHNATVGNIRNQNTYDVLALFNNDRPVAVFKVKKH